MSADTVFSRRHLMTLPAGLLLITAFLPAQEKAVRSFGEQLGTDLERHVAGSRLAILPLGAIEYHGPSGSPLADSIIGEGIARRVAADIDASLFPVLNYAHCPAHTAGFRGSISVRPEVVTMLLADVLRGIVGNGFARVLMLNAHSGNAGPARAAASQVAAEKPGSQFVLVNWWETLPTPDVVRLNLFTSGNGGHGHGGPLELSVAAFFAPQAVRAGQGPDLPALEPEAAFPYFLQKRQARGWSGYSGKLSEISAEKGKVLAELAIERIGRLVADWLADDTRPGSW